ncbi:MAG: tail protein X [Betaproteobacteria bacterium]|nr:tail protein X [Betaproteobacteria bacterium]
MAKIIRTSEGDILDSLCYAIYGNLSGTVEAVLDQNPGLARVAQPYDSGVLIAFPDLPPPQRDDLQLWS